MAPVRTRPESLPVALLLTMVGGFLDAFTFVGYGGVFANAQTGNIVLLGVEAGERRWGPALLHVPPVLAFLLGVTVAAWLGHPAAVRIVKRPTRVALGVEILVTSAIGFMPGWPGQAVTTTVAFAAAVQVSTFRSLDGTGYSTTLTTSNLRSLVEKTYQWRAGRDVTAGRQAAQLAAVILAFGAGAGAGGWCTRLLGPRAAWVAAAGLGLALGCIVTETAARSRRERTGEHGPDLPSPAVPPTGERGPGPGGGNHPNGVMDRSYPWGSCSRRGSATRQQGHDHARLLPGECRGPVRP
jgi:uncharacterized membrane protein YoaK (UPF0700 family)